MWNSFTSALENHQVLAEVHDIIYRQPGTFKLRKTNCQKQAIKIARTGKYQNDKTATSVHIKPQLHSLHPNSWYFILSVMEAKLHLKFCC
jgi:hypothetical protein